MIVKKFSIVLVFVIIGISCGWSSDALLQYQVLEGDLKNRARFERFADETYHTSALIHASDRDPLDVLLRRTRVLFDDISKMHHVKGAGKLKKQLLALEKKVNQSDIAQKDLRKKLFAEVHQLRRKIAFANPLLDFNQILLIKRHRATFNHMCDQYYGTNAVPGGGVFVLKNPFSDNAKALDLLQGVKVTSGRLKGSTLEGGSYLSPELSYDGKKLYFSYVECEGSKEHIKHLDHEKRGHWERGRCYHVFSCDLNEDGKSVSNLRQLTDGTFNDFDPCPLPNGRVAFVSERRGGYLRCGRACPSYTLFDMKPDGSDIRVLSPHENNEWQPSVNHDGMIIYTRWDYVDRHGCTAHHPWIMTPDGRNSRAMHGNFSIKSKRADMEMDLRAIPDSPKIVGTAAPHHSQAYGSIIVYDPRVADDDAMAPVKRLTPDEGFPESQVGSEVYGTPWAISEKYYLCVYDPKMRKSGKKRTRGEYGVYLLDAFGNKILLYRDEEIASLSPMPLRARKTPPALPEMSERLAQNPSATGTMAVMNVYDSHLPWPEERKIKALRIYQIIPSSVPSGKAPHQTGLRIAEAKDSVNLARKVLGTVPVETDGSAYFTVPALKEVYFQALDKDGLAVQSMRSATWVQPGERMICQGCHEPKDKVVSQNHKALALKRAPSVPKPESSGTNPFSYPLLVQPVLDKHCVECHAKNLDKGAMPLDDKIVKARLGDSPTPVFRSYDNLIHKYGFWKFGDHYRTIPGKFGAHESKLYKILKAGHYDVKLSSEEMRRITVWLDSMSNFYGVYEKEGGAAQLRGEVVQPTLE